MRLNLRFWNFISADDIQVRRDDEPQIAPRDDRDKKEAGKCDGKPKNTTTLNVTETIFPTENKIRGPEFDFSEKLCFLHYILQAGLIEQSTGFMLIHVFCYFCFY